MRTKIIPIKNPPHPGLSIKDPYLDLRGLSVSDAANALGVARHTLSRVLNEHGGISAGMNIRFEKAGWSIVRNLLYRRASAPKRIGVPYQIRELCDPKEWAGVRISRRPSGPSTEKLH